jgi:hypothetical protein
MKAARYAWNAAATTNAATYESEHYGGKREATNNHVTHANP